MNRFTVYNISVFEHSFFSVTKTTLFQLIFYFIALNTLGRFYERAEKYCIFYGNPLIFLTFM